MLGFILLPFINSKAQDNKKMTSSTILGYSVYSLGSYNQKGHVYYIEQNINYHVVPKFSVGIETGFNLYPGAYTIPIGVISNYFFKSYNKGGYISESIGQNIYVGKYSFRSARNIGVIGIAKKYKRIGVGIESGYSMLWDKFGGGALSLILRFNIQF